jgi:hypothetical protein
MSTKAKNPWLHDWAPVACTKAISCPTCLAPKGKRCNTDRPLHLERWDAWAASGYRR